MRRKREDRRLYEGDGKTPIPLEAVHVLAGLAPGMELTADDLPPGIAGNETAEEAMVTVEELGRLLRVSESTVRRLIRTAVIRPVLVDGQPRVPLRQVEACRAGLHRNSPDKPGE
ncbi:MAG TPA: helix-turn-helix domain-containing protein [Candidatus Limnocylindria bacterium]|nr:helix-turn-helix domain-containing protein [Candidatus Limnocylindria bacterium]